MNRVSTGLYHRTFGVILVLIDTPEFSLSGTHHQSRMTKTPFWTYDFSLKGQQKQGSFTKRFRCAPFLAAIIVVEVGVSERLEKTV